MKVVNKDRLDNLNPFCLHILIAKITQFIAIFLLCSISKFSNALKSIFYKNLKNNLIFCSFFLSLKMVYDAHTLHRVFKWMIVFCLWSEKKDISYFK